MKLTTLALLLIPAVAVADEPVDRVHYPGGEGPGQGKHIVFLTGDEEYRSEESQPMMARMLSERFGFETTVLFAINRETGEIDPDQTDNLPGVAEVLPTADLMVQFLRWRNLPDEQTGPIIDYTNSGKPILAIRTGTHPFKWREGDQTSYERWGWNKGESGGGYGRDVLGETWVTHYGKHNEESTLGLPAYQQSDHPILSGVEQVWDPGDVYGIKTDPERFEPILLGVILQGMSPDDPPRPDRELVPVLWTREYEGETGNTSRVVTTTLGTAEGFENEGFRRAIVNSMFWLLDLDVPKKADVEPIRTYEPLPSGFGGHRKGVFPKDLQGRVSTAAADDAAADEAAADDVAADGETANGAAATPSQSKN